MLGQGLDGLDGCREVVGAVVLGHAADLPETELQPLGKGLETFGKAEGDGLDVGIGQHEVKQQMREGYGGPLVKHSRWVSFPYGASQRRCETVDTRSEPKRCDAMPATAAHRPGCRPGQGVQPRSGPLTWATSSAMLGSSARSQLSCFGTAQSGVDWPALDAAARYCRRRSSAQDPGGLPVACHSRPDRPPHISHCARGAR